MVLDKKIIFPLLLPTTPLLQHSIIPWAAQKLRIIKNAVMSLSYRIFWVII